MPNKEIIKDYLSVFCLIAISGFEFFYSDDTWIAVGLVITFLVANSRGVLNRFDRSVFFIIGIFVFWEFIQYLLLWDINLRIRPLLGTIGRLFIGYLVIKSVNYNYLKIYVNIIAAFAYISIFFYLMFFIPAITEPPMNFGDKYFTTQKKADDSYFYHKSNIIIFNFHGYELTPKRNSGPFWEPGAFAVFLTLALVFDLLINKSLFSRQKLVMLIALITTLSTTGYLIFFLISINYVFLKGRRNMALLALVPVVIYISYQTFREQAFLESKIEDNISDQTTGSRFGSALADIALIVKNPILGYGREIKAMYGTEDFDIESMHRNNALTKVFVQWGILAFLYLFYIYRGFKKICMIYRNELKIAPVFLFVVLLLNAFSQPIFQYPFFFGLMFLQFIEPKFYRHQMTRNFA